MRSMTHNEWNYEDKQFTRVWKDLNRKRLFFWTNDTALDIIDNLPNINYEIKTLLLCPEVAAFLYELNLLQSDTKKAFEVLLPNLCMLAFRYLGYFRAVWWVPSQAFPSAWPLSLFDEWFLLHRESSCRNLIWPFQSFFVETHPFWVWLSIDHLRRVLPKVLILIFVSHSIASWAFVALHSSVLAYLPLLTFKTRSPAEPYLYFTVFVLSS